VESAAKFDVFLLPEERMAVVAKLVGSIVQSGREFTLYPPKEVTSDPAVLKSPEIVSRLAKAKWWLRIDDGTEEILTLPELVGLLYNLLAARRQLDDVKRRAKTKGSVSIGITFDAAKLMTPESVRNLLGKVNLEGLSKG
jgi:hypothetical protein